MYSGRQALATLCTATSQHAQAAHRFTALAKAMTALTNELTRLIGAFHGTCLQKA